MCATSTFIRRLQYTLRITLSFLIGGFITYGTPLNDQLTTQYLIPVMCILAIQETFGMTLLASYQMITALIPLSIFLYIIQKLGVGYGDYLAAELLLLVSSFALSYKCTQIQPRKIALLISSIFFATIVNQQNLPSTFIFTLLEEFVIGISVSLLVSLLVFPLFATIDIENRMNYCLKNLQRMESIVIQAFLCEDQMSAQVSLARSSTLEQMIRVAMNLIHTRLNETQMEPSRLLQRIFNRRRRHLMDLTLQEQEHFVSSWMFHVCSLQLMVKQCRFNEYHNHFKQELQVDLAHLDSCQCSMVSDLTSSTVPTREQFDDHLGQLQQALKTLRQTSIEARLSQVEHSLQSATKIHSDDHLSHAFFLFQLATIIRLLTQVTNYREKQSFLQTMQDVRKKKQKTKHRSILQVLKPQWPRIASALKSTIIIGVGSIFVMVPRLADIFENGQWILIALCMTQGDTVGGALTTMKRRLIGTLLGAMWAYITYLSVGDHIYNTFGMLVPWILVFGYLKSAPEWNYAAVVASFTPVLINLGRIPYGPSLPAGNYALLRIEENLVGIAIATVLTILIFPVFAIDVLKKNIESEVYSHSITHHLLTVDFFSLGTLQLCRQSINGMQAIYDQLFQNEQFDVTVVDMEKTADQEIKSFVDAQRSRFHQLISSQRMLLEFSALEPTLWWFQNAFPTVRYEMLASQQTDIFRMLHNVDAILMRIHECSKDETNPIKDLQMYGNGGVLPSALHNELTTLSRQLSECVNLWASYFTLTQTRCYRLARECSFSRTSLLESDLLKHEQCLIELHQTIHRLQTEHQGTVDRLLNYCLDRITQGDTIGRIVPYVDNERAYVIFLGIAAMHYSTTELARAALALGTNIHTIFELETTKLYRSF
ncbi:unnamed protein product [Adineta ricciae]|uniref:Integral membrane bound transporter domain-containing protein n=1 Tax=Adineta ricciae TaxID=249248 RepID=A0A814RN71_ADIRI|nr:unnamed protein product [Adineta ricciae]